MSKRNCESCLFGDICSIDRVCGHYTPIDDEASDAAIDQRIQEGREEYRREWNGYMAENQDI